MKKNLKWKLLATIVVCCIAVYFVLTKPIPRGIDLAGGTYFTIEVMTDGLSDEKKNEAVDQTLAVYRNRVDEIGVAGTIIQRAGENQIRVQIPGIDTKESERIKGILSRQAHLEFRVVVDGPGKPITINNKSI